MKKIIFLLLVVALSAGSALAQREDVTMIPIMRKSLEYIDFLENKQDMEIVRIEYDIVTTEKESYRMMSDQYEYGIIAFGDDRIKDLDVRVYAWNGSDWALVAKDSDSSNVAAANVSPSSSGNYKIVVSAYSFNDDYTAGHYGLIIFHE